MRHLAHFAGIALLLCSCAPQPQSTSMGQTGPASTHPADSVVMVVVGRKVCLGAVQTTEPTPTGKFHARVIRATPSFQNMCPEPDSPEVIVVHDTTTVTEQYHPDADRTVRCLHIRMTAPQNATALRAYWGTTMHNEAFCPVRDDSTPVLVDTLTTRRSRG